MAKRHVVDEESDCHIKNNEFQRPGAKHYAQTLIVVTLIVVNIFVLLVITRDHGSFGGCH